MAALEALEATFHAISGVVLDAGEDPDTATGRVACLAHHVTRSEGEPRDLVWAITYRDRYARTGEGWRFTRRAMHITFVATDALRAARTHEEHP